MDFEQQLRTAFAPCNPRPELRSSILARRSALHGSPAGKGRSRSRTILFGTILAVAAAAAMLVLYLTDRPKPQLVEEAPVATPAVEAAAPAREVPSSIAPAPAESATKTALSEKALPEKALPPIKSFTVRLLPLQNGATEPGSRAAIDSFFMAFANRLRAVPGLSLVLSDTDDPVDVELPDFQITLKGSGSETTNKFSIVVLGDQKFILEGKRKLGKEQGAKIEGFSFITSVGGDILPACVPATNEDISGCRSPTAVAAWLVESLRRRNFPADPLLKSQMLSRLMNASLDPTQRLKALTDIGFLQSSTPNGALKDPAVVLGAIALGTTATDPAVRAQVWRAMRGSRNPDLVNPVTASLLQERDSEVRRQAVILLQEDFSGDPRAREALQVVAREEPRPLVRALATRALTGETSWQNHIVASLKDTNLSDADRIEAFMYQVATPGRVPGSFTYSSSRSLDLLDDEAFHALTRLLPEAAKAPEGKQTMRSILSSLGSLKKPAVTPMFIGMLEQPGELTFRYSIVEELSRRASDPVVRAALEKINREDPDARMRELAANALDESSTSR